MVLIFDFPVRINVGSYFTAGHPLLVKSCVKTGFPESRDNFARVIYGAARVNFNRRLKVKMVSCEVIVAFRVNVNGRLVEPFLYFFKR